MTEKKPKGAKIKTYRREVTFDLTHEESERYGRELAAKKRQRDSILEKAKQTQANFRGQVGVLSTDIDRLAVAVDDNKELRNAEVEDWLDGSQVFTYKVGEYEKPVDQRPAGFADEQTDMFADLETPVEPQHGKRKDATPDPGAVGGGSDDEREHDAADFQPPPAAPTKKKRKKKPA